ncbi:MAG: glycosyltransferase family 4 protein [Flavobacteriales bacterium]|nr:glycosyltransferase family 4 protein [Flavobacteriales bacterium]MCB9446975.1 glycosyltransferase family 4 protein [Flavobacteriales bacterium]
MNGEKRRILYIAAHRPGRSPGQRFRFEQYMPLLEANGYEITHSHIIDEKDDKVFYSRGNYLRKTAIIFKSFLRRLDDVLKANHFDLIIVYREAIMLGSTVFERMLRKSDTPVVMDFDDAIWLQDVSEGNERLAWLKRPSKTDEIIAMSNAVFAGNTYLANYAKRFNPNVHLIPTTIDVNYHLPAATRPSEGTVRVGWTGTSTTLKHYDEAVPALKELKTRWGDRVRFRVIADVPPCMEGFDVEFVKWNKHSEIQDLATFDIGLMPLPDNDWARGKCGFKGLQYMSMGIPAVMSPVGVNADIITDGVNGFLASSQQDWLEKLSRLIESETLRKQLGTAGRKTVEDRFSLQAIGPHYLELIDRLINRT